MSISLKVYGFRLNSTVWSVRKSWDNTTVVYLPWFGGRELGVWFKAAR